MADDVITTSPLATVSRLTQLGTLLGQRLDAALASLGITNAEAEVLGAVAGHCASLGLTPTQLGSQLLVSSGGITKRLDNLENRGLLRRAPNPDDRRSTTISLTAEGERLADLALEAARHTAASVLDGLDVAEQASLTETLQRVIDGMVDSGC